jgi:hypothetical protein
MMLAPGETADCQWRTYDYLVLSYPFDHPFDCAPDILAGRMTMAPVAVLIWMSDAEAALVAADVSGLIPTDEPEIYEFRGDRQELDRWALKHHPGVIYRWLDRVRISFADDAAKGWWDWILDWRRIASRPVSEPIQCGPTALALVL